MHIWTKMIIRIDSDFCSLYLDSTHTSILCPLHLGIQFDFDLVLICYGSSQISNWTLLNSLIRFVHVCHPLILLSFRDHWHKENDFAVGSQSEGQLFVMLLLFHLAETKLFQTNLPFQRSPMPSTFSSSAFNTVWVLMRNNGGKYRSLKTSLTKRGSSTFVLFYKGTARVISARPDFHKYTVVAWKVSCGLYMYTLASACVSTCIHQ